MNSEKRKESLQIATKTLKDGGVILCPTDTIYGLSCDAKNTSAIEKIREIKGREEGKSFIVLVNSVRLLNQCTSNIPEVAWDMIENASSPLTLVLPASNYLDEVLRPNNMVAVRFVKDVYAADLIHKFNSAIVSTSANLSGQASPKSFEEISTEIKEKVDYIVPTEYDHSNQIRASKIVMLKENGEVQILRK